MQRVACQLSLAAYRVSVVRVAWCVLRGMHCVLRVSKCVSRYACKLSRDRKRFTRDQGRVSRVACLWSNRVQKVHFRSVGRRWVNRADSKDPLTPRRGGLQRHFAKICRRVAHGLFWPYRRRFSKLRITRPDIACEFLHLWPRFCKPRRETEYIPQFRQNSSIDTIPHFCILSVCMRMAGNRGSLFACLKAEF